MYHFLVAIPSIQFKITHDVTINTVLSNLKLQWTVKFEKKNWFKNLGNRKRYIDKQIS